MIGTKGCNRGREAQRLPAIGNLTPAPVKAQRAPSFRASAVLTLLIITAAIWMLFVRLAPGGKVSSAPLTKSHERADGGDRSRSARAPCSA